MLNIKPISERAALPRVPLTLDRETLDATERMPRLRLAADGMTAGAILDAIARLVPAADPRVEVAVDVTNAWSIPWTTQPIRLATTELEPREAYVRHKGFRWASSRTEAVYEVTAA